MIVRHLLAAAAAFAISTSAIAADSSFELVTEAELRDMIGTMASDEFAGRKPGTDGETRTLAYITDAFWKAGLTGGSQDESRWYQPVDLVEAESSAGRIVMYKNGRALSLDQDDAVMIAGGATVGFTGLPVVFTGFGVDGEGKAIGDVEGALAIMMAGAPSYVPGTDEMRGFATRRDALLDAGASAVLAVFDETTSFDRVQRFFMGGSTSLATGGAMRVRGAMSVDYASGMMKAAGVDMADVVKAADSSSYAGVALDLTADVATGGTRREFTSHNVIARLPGTNRDAGAVMLMGHWDHLGICRPEGSEDRICNGATDNASGIAVLIAVARRLAEMGPFDRDIYFLATTAEESGLLGAEAYVENPAFPLEDIVIALNVDTIAIAERNTKVAIIGRGYTELEPDIERVARSLGRKIDGSDDANAFVQRQDGWALLQRGVPALMVGGSFADQSLLQAFLSGAYHQPDDELTDAMPLGGAAEDADLHIALAAYFADMARFEGKSDE